MPNTTTNYAFYKPLVNDPVDQDLWGGYWNTNADTLDSVLNTRLFDYNFADYKLQRPIITDYCEEVEALGNVSGNVAIDMSLGNHFSMTATGNISGLTITNVPPTGNAAPLVIYITQDGTGGWTFTPPAAFIYAGGSTPTLTTTAGRTDIFTNLTRNAGTSWASSIYGQNFAGL